MYEEGIDMNGISAILRYLEAYTVPLVITAIVIFFSIRFGNLGFEYIANKLKGKKHEELIDVRANVNVTIQCTTFEKPSKYGANLHQECRPK